MSFHLLAWYESAAADDTAVDMTPVTDNIVAIQNSHFVPQENWDLLFAYFTGPGSSTGRARLITPTYRQFSPPFINPTNDLHAAGDPVYVADYRDNPLRIPALEELEMEGLQDSAGAGDIAGLIGMSRNQRPAPRGDIFSMRGTSATAAVADAWTTITVAWADTLPAGTYAVVGLRYEATGPIAARLIFDDQVDRPGTPGTLNQQGLLPNVNRMGGLGEWGRFTANRMPIVEVICNAASTDHVVYLDFVRVG